MATLLTFAYLRDLQKKERDSRKPEKLGPDFYSALKEFLARKSAASAGSALEKSELEVAVPVIRYILERREQKVIESAMAFVRAGIRPENLLAEELVLFENVCGVLKKHKGMIDEIFGVPNQENGQEATDKSDGAASSAAQEKDALDGKMQPIKIKLLRDVPAFIAEDIAAHGPWSAGLTAECPPKAAAILVENGFAEYV